MPGSTSAKPRPTDDRRSLTPDQPQKPSSTTPNLQPHRRSRRRRHHDRRGAAVLAAGGDPGPRQELRAAALPMQPGDIACGCASPACGDRRVFPATWDAPGMAALRGRFCPIRAARSRAGDIDIATASIDERQLGRRRARDPKRGHPIIGEGGLGALWTPIEQSALHIEHSTRSAIDAARSLRAKCDVAPPRVSGCDARAAATRPRRRHLVRLAARLLRCGSCRLVARGIVAAMPANPRPDWTITANY